MDLKPYSLSVTAARTDPLSDSGTEGVCDDEKGVGVGGGGGAVRGKKRGRNNKGQA